MTSLFDKSPAAQSSTDELAALAKEFPDLAKDDTPPSADPQEPPAKTPEKPAGEAPAATDTKPADAAKGATKAPETPEKPATEGDQKPSPRMVPAPALAEAREKAREEAAQRQQLEQQVAELRGRLEQVTRMVQPAPQPAQPQAQPEDPAPDPNEDPMAFMAWQGRENQRLRQQFGQVAGYLQQQAVVQNVQSAYLSDAQQFMAERPDLPAAYNHLFSTRVAELRAQGYNDDVIRQQVQREEFHIVAQALQNRRRPAEVAYELAKSRGYMPPVAKPAEAAPAVAAPAADQLRNPDGTFAKAPPAVDPALAEAKARAAAGHREGGTTPESELALADIVKLKGDDFDKALKKYEGRNVRRPGGGLFRE